MEEDIFFLRQGTPSSPLSFLSGHPGRQKKQKSSSHQHFNKIECFQNISQKSLVEYYIQFLQKITLVASSKRLIPTRSQERPLSFLGRHNGDMEEMNDFLGSWKAETQHNVSYYYIKCISHIFSRVKLHHESGTSPQLPSRTKWGHGLDGVLPEQVES